MSQRSCRSSTPQLLEPAELEPSSSPRSLPGSTGAGPRRRGRCRRRRRYHALAERARAAGVRFAGWPESFELDADVTLVTAGPWTSRVVDPTGGWRPIEAVWGVVAEVELEQPPRHVLEEAGIPELADALGAGERGAQLFSLVSSEGRHGLGSTFTHEEPDERPTARALVERGKRFLRDIGADPRDARLRAPGVRRRAAADGTAREGPLRVRGPRPVGHLDRSGVGPARRAT